MTREELKKHCERQIQRFERVEKIMPIALNDRKRYEEHKLILEFLEQEPRKGHWIRVDKDKLRCSECDVIHLIAQYPQGKIEWCPNCGARMESDLEKRKPCINYLDGCEEWAGCPCVYYKAESEDKE